MAALSAGHSLAGRGRGGGSRPPHAGEARARNMLDIGGSHGFYSVALCRRHPHLAAVILDLPEAIKEAAPILAMEGVGDRIRHQVGDALTQDLGENCYDLILISNLAHHFTDEQNRGLMLRAARALTPGGSLVIQE